MEFNLILDEDELQESVEFYSGVDSFSFDVETMGTHRLDPLRNHVVWLSMATEGRTDVFPMRHPNGDFVRWDYPLLKSGRYRLSQGKEPRKSDYSRDKRKATPLFTPPPGQLDRATVLGALAPVFAGPALKIAHNAKFDINSLYKHTPVLGLFWDTQTVEWVIDSSLHGSLSLAACVERRLGVFLEKGVGNDISRHGFEEVAIYSALDARRTYDLYLSQGSDLPLGLDEVVVLEQQVVEVLADMERTGIRVDVEKLRGLEEEFTRCIDQSVADAFRAAGRKFNINSVQEKQRLLFSPRDQGGQGLKGKVLTDAGQKRRENGVTPQPTDFSTSADALAKYKAPLVVALKEHAKWTKLLSTYVRPYLGGETQRVRGSKTVTEYVPSLLVDGRLHTRFVQDRAETGRLSSRSPNLQNVPARSEEGRKIRDLFVPSPGMVLVDADYSQIEPRIIASLSNDPVMLETYRDGGDVYMSVAEMLSVDRSVGKTLVLAIAYGIGATAIADRNSMSRTEAQELMDYFSAKFPRIPAHRNHVLSEVRRRRPHYSVTVAGRRRYLPDMTSRDRMYRASAERRAYNHVIQGSAADVLKVALVNVHHALPPEARMLLTVHDEIVLEVPESLAGQAEETLCREMERAGEKWFTVPLVAETKVGRSWGECKG